MGWRGLGFLATSLLTSKQCSCRQSGWLCQTEVLLSATVSPKADRGAAHRQAAGVNEIAHCPMNLENVPVRTFYPKLYCCLKLWSHLIFYIRNGLFASVLSYRLQTAQAYFRFEEWKGGQAQSPHLNNRHINILRGSRFCPPAVEKSKGTARLWLFISAVSLLLHKSCSVSPVFVLFRKTRFVPFIVSSQRSIAEA